MLTRSGNFDTKILNDKYVVLLRKVLGSGSFATVYKGYMKNKSDFAIAIKMMQTFRLKNKNEDQHFKFLQRELQIQQAFSSSHIVKMIDVIKCDQVNYLILEYCEEGNLANRLNTQPNKKLPYNEALTIFAQIVKGYQELYKEKVIHRDLKPENILFKDGKAKIADFGFAKIVDEMEIDGTHTQVGTLLYCAPELMQGLKFCSKADVWSLGCIFYEMLYGKTPFNEYNPQKLLKQITTQPLTFPPDDDIKDEVINFLKKMLQPNPENRMRWDEVFTNKLMELSYPQSNTDILSDKSTYVSDEQRFIVHEQQKKQQDEISDKVKLQLQFYANIYAFINQTIRQFYSVFKDLKISKETQLLISIASTKYILIETFILRQILQNNQQQQQLNQQMALRKINSDEINYLRQNNLKYYEVLNCINNQSITLTPFIENLKQSFKKVKQIQNSAFSPANIQKMEQMLNADVINDVFIQNYNDSLKLCIKECLQIQKQKENVLLGFQISKCIIYLFYCFQPFKFQQQSLEPKNVESNINQLSQKDLDQQIEKLSIEFKLN